MIVFLRDCGYGLMMVDDTAHPVRRLFPGLHTPLRLRLGGPAALGSDTQSEPLPSAHTRPPPTPFPADITPSPILPGNTPDQPM